MRFDDLDLSSKIFSDIIDEETDFDNMKKYVKMFDKKDVSDNIYEVKAIYGVIDLDGIDRNIERLVICGEDIEIKNIEQIKYLRNLKFLFIENSDIEDLSFLSDMPKLRILNICGSRITDISPLKNLKLYSLWLYNNKISDIRCLRNFKYIDILHELSVMDNPIKDYSPITTASALENISISDEGGFTYSQLSAIKELKNLKYINNYEIDFKQLNYEWKLEVLIKNDR